jgi:hypothetical protein
MVLMIAIQNIESVWKKCQELGTMKDMLMVGRVKCWEFQTDVSKFKNHENLRYSSGLYRELWDLVVALAGVTLSLSTIED